MMKEKNIREIARRMNLVTIDDMCRYSIPQLVLMIANKMNELIDGVGQFESEVDEIVKSQNEKIQHLLGEGLLLEVENVFNGWFKDGIFDTLINQSALKKVNERIDETKVQLSQKLDKSGIVTMSNMGQDVKEAMTGGSVAVVGKDMVLSENIVNRQVTREKTNYYNYLYDGNLVNPLSIVKGRGYYSNGELAEVSTKCMVTIYKDQVDFVNTHKINYTVGCDICFWGKQNEFISGYYWQHVNLDNPGVLDNIPVTTHHVTFTFNVDDIPNTIICKEEVYSKTLTPLYTDRELKVEPTQLLSGIDVTKIADFKLNPKGNLISRLNTVHGYYYWFEDGSKRVSDDAYSVSYPLDVEKSYVINFDSSVTYWDENGQFISGRMYGSLSGTTNTSWINPSDRPSNAKEIRLLIYAADRDRAVFAEKDFFKKDLKTSYYIDGLVEDSKVSSYLNNNPLNNKKAVFLGDSWCAGNAESNGNWATRIKANNPTLTVTNYGLHGADWSQCNIHVLDHADKLAVMKEADYIIIEAYTNGLYGDVSSLTKPLGTINEFTYQTLEEIEALPNSYAKDLEKALYRIATECHGKKIGVIFPYKAVAHLSPSNAFVAFRSQVMACCRKYNIPVFDNFDGCNIPSWHEELRKEYYVENDTVHLNAKGYDVITPSIENWMKLL